jgi:hypothetical protein
MTQSTGRIGAGLIAALVVAGAVPAFKANALPRYAARYEQTCALCHLNPTGAGMRTPYASKELAPRELAWSPATPAMLESIDPQISKNISVGADFREVYVGSDVPAHHLGFFQMQGDLYFAFQLDSTSVLYFDRGQSGSYEMFGLHYPTPWLYLKAGRFVPSYGWKFDDHTHFVRSDLGFQPPGNSDVGLEVGVARGPLDLQASLMNGNRGGINDNDQRLAVGSSLLYRLRAGPVALGAGASSWHQPGSQEDLDLIGVRGYLNWRTLTWLGEADRVRRERFGAFPVLVGLATSHELTWTLHQGLELEFTYDFFDPDVDFESGVRTRYGGGVFLMPRSFVALEALYRNTREDPGPAFVAGDFQEAVMQVHVLY